MVNLRRLVRRGLTFNRTSLELKRGERKNTEIPTPTFNRTSLELKLGPMSARLVTPCF